jgi:predicted  nucleic acid-binding Zn-ribbon protein
MAKKDACSVISLLSTNDKYHVSAEITLRLAPEKVTEISALAAKDATITSRHTAADDLGSTIRDNQQRLTALQKYRDQLNSVLARKDINPDQLIALARELATTQSQIEELSMNRSNIQQRIDTELLTIRLTTPDPRLVNQETPIKDALARCGTNFEYAIAEVISFIAGFIPWSIVLVSGFAALRWSWIRFGRRVGRSAIPKQ